MYILPPLLTPSSITAFNPFLPFYWYRWVRCSFIPPSLRKILLNGFHSLRTVYHLGIFPGTVVPSSLFARPPFRQSRSCPLSFYPFPLPATQSPFSSPASKIPPSAPQMSFGLLKKWLPRLRKKATVLFGAISWRVTHICLELSSTSITSRALTIRLLCCVADPTKVEWR